MPRGTKTRTALDFTNADWKVGTSRTADGYIIEFEIPLALIDTRDGPEYVPATSGSELLVNFGIIDNDDSRHRSSGLRHLLGRGSEPLAVPRRRGFLDGEPAAGPEAVVSRHTLGRDDRGPGVLSAGKLDSAANRANSSRRDRERSPCSEAARGDLVFLSAMSRSATPSRIASRANVLITRQTRLSDFYRSR